MSTQPNKWRENLEQIFAATVNQLTLEEAVDRMVSVSARDQSYHIECLAALDEGTHAADAGDSLVIDAVNKSGYQVKTVNAAADLLRDFKAIYLAAFDRMRA